MKDNRGKSRFPPKLGSEEFAYDIKKILKKKPD